MPKALSSKPEPYQHEWRPGALRRDLHRLGLSAEGLRQVGRTGLPVGRSTASRDTAAPRSRRGTGRSGTKPTSATGAARRRSSCKLHDYAIDAVRRALPDGARRRTGHGRQRPAVPARLPRTTACAARTTPPARRARRSTSSRSTPRARPRSSTATCAWASRSSCARSTTASRTVASFPELKDKPIVIGESDPEGCAACQGPQLAYRNGTMYSSYTAASFARKHDLADKHGVNLEGALTWAFEFEDQPYFAGLPRAGQQRHRPAGAQCLPHVQPNDGRPRQPSSSDAVGAARQHPARRACAERRTCRPWRASTGTDSGSWSGTTTTTTCPVPTPRRRSRLSGLPTGTSTARLTHYRIDRNHSNSYAAWLGMGSPLAPNRDQYAALQSAARLATIEPPSEVAVTKGKASVRFVLPRQAVSLVAFEWGGASTPRQP